jgi:hypothetical protein
MKNLKRCLAMLVVLSFIFTASCTGKGDKEAESVSEAVSEAESDNPILKIVTSNDGNRLYESMEYTFIPDKEVIGTWEIVNGVEKIEDFEAGKFAFTSTEKILLQKCIFFDNGEVACDYLDYYLKDAIEKWTKGYILFSLHNVIPAYTIQQIDGKSYMFIEWKLSDYLVSGKIPCYLVLKKHRVTQLIPLKHTTMSWAKISM